VRSHCSGDSSRDLELNRCLGGGGCGRGFRHPKTTVWPGAGAGCMEESRQDWPSTAEKYTAGGGTKRTKNNRTYKPVEFSKKIFKNEEYMWRATVAGVRLNNNTALQRSERRIVESTNLSNFRKNIRK
jgi:hypothetical protein